jgi:5-methylcytosine-specific restriction enzyme A
MPKQVDPHYQSDQHIAWRNAIIARAGRCCERCGRTNVRLFADHIVELRDGGNPFELANGQALCGMCHSVKTMQERAKRR